MKIKSNHESNHNVELWLPQRIVFVIGRNHSITFIQMEFTIIEKKFT
ncbi:DUF6710 family protein [Paenibacillus faecalis]